MSKVMRFWAGLLICVSLAVPLVATASGTASATEHCSITRPAVTRIVRVRVRRREHGKIRMVTVKRRRVVRVRRRVRVKIHGKWRIRERWVIKRRIVRHCVVVTPSSPSTPSTNLTTTAPSPGTTTPPSPVTRFSAVDPSFTQASNNPLAVTYTYSADATETIGGTTTNLGSISQLPAGVLNLYSDGSLVCAKNVGGATVGGTCQVTYTTTGSHTVVTEYVPNGYNAVESTETVNVSPFTTTTVLGSVNQSYSSVACGTAGVGDTMQDWTITVSSSTTDQNGNALSAANTSYSVKYAGPFISQVAPQNPFTVAGSTGPVSFDFTSPCGGQIYAPSYGYYPSLTITATWGSETGYAASTSTAQTIQLTTA